MRGAMKGRGRHLPCACRPTLPSRSIRCRVSPRSSCCLRLQAVPSLRPSLGSNSADPVATGARLVLSRGGHCRGKHDYPLRPPQRRDRRCSGARGRLLPRCPARTLSDHGRQPGHEPQPLPRRSSRRRRADLCEDRPRSELEQPGIYHHGGAKRGRTHCNRAQPILWRSRIERQSAET